MRRHVGCEKLEKSSYMILVIEYESISLALMSFRR